MGTMRVMDSDANGDSIAQHMLQLEKDGATVIAVSLVTPEAVLRPQLSENMWVVDAVTCVSGQPPPGGKNVMFLQSPTMLEMLAMRTEQIASQQKNPHVVLDNLNTMALYNGLAPTQEFVHYFTNRLRSIGAKADFVMRNVESGELQDAIRPFVDARD